MEEIKEKIEIGYGKLCHSATNTPPYARNFVYIVYLRNEFHFSDGHEAMNHSGSRAK